MGEYRTPSRALIVETEPVIDKLEHAYHSGDFSEVERNIHEWLDKMVQEAWFITDVYTCCSRLLRRFLSVYSNDQLELMGLQSWNAMQWVTKRRTMDVLRDDLLGFLRGIVVHTEHYSGNIQSIVAKVQAIIERDYRMPELSILQLAKELYISPRTYRPFSRKNR